jgi:hypothetical protein
MLKRSLHRLPGLLGRAKFLQLHVLAGLLEKDGVMYALSALTLSHVSKMHNQSGVMKIVLHPDCEA